jgi:calcium-binding protein CML
MGTVLPTMQAATCLHMNDSVILSMLDQSWYAQPIQTAINPDYSMAVCFPSIESGRTSRSSGLDLASEKIKRFYSANELELRRVFDRFDKNSDGLICREELRQYMRCCYGKDLSDEEAKSIISCVDYNNDGAVDFEEFLSLYQQPDDTSSGNNFAVEYEDEEQDLLDAFRIFDTNEDGFISPHELQAVLLNLGIPEGNDLISCEKMIRNVDRNGDGQCDFREFQEMMSARCSF